MATTNHDHVGRALDLLRAGLAPFVAREVTERIKAQAVRMDALQRFAEDPALADPPMVEKPHDSQTVDCPPNRDNPRSGTASTTPWPRASSPPSNTSCSTARTSTTITRRAEQSSSSSRDGITPIVVTGASVSNPPWPSRGATRKLHETQALNRPLKRGNSNVADRRRDVGPRVAPLEGARRSAPAPVLDAPGLPVPAYEPCQLRPRQPHHLCQVAPDQPLVRLAQSLVWNIHYPIDLWG